MKPLTKQTVKTASKFVTIGLLIGLLIGAFIAYGQSPTSTFTISSGVYPGSPSYTIWTEGSSYFAKDANGLIRFSGTGFTVLFASVMDAMPIYGGVILLKTGYYEGYCVIDRDGIILEGEGVYSDIPAGIPDNSPTTLYGSVIKVTTAGVAGINITGQRYGIQIKDLGIWFTESSTGCGITTDMTQTYTLTHATIENVKILNCDKDSYAIQLCNFLHVNVRAIMAFGGPLLHLYANMPDFKQGNSIFDNLYGYIKYDLSPISLSNGPYPIFIQKNDTVSDLTPTLTNLVDMRRIQINNPTGCADADYYTFTAFKLEYSTLLDFNFEGANLQNHTVLLGSCQHLTVINMMTWEMDPGDALVSLASNNQYITFMNCALEDVWDFNYTDVYVNCRIANDIHSNTQASFIGLNNTSGTATLTSGQTSMTVSARFIGPNDYVLLTIIDSDALAAGEALKVDTINRAPTNTFVVNCIDEGAISSTTTFYWQIVHATP